MKIKCKFTSIFIILLFILLPNSASATVDNTTTIHHIRYPSDNFDIIITSDQDPYYGILGSSIACRYPTIDEPILKPLLVTSSPILLSQQERFIEQYKDHIQTILCLGTSIETSYETICLGETPLDVSFQLISLYKNVDTAIILPYGNQTEYTMALTASPLASYLEIPILLYDDNTEQIEQTLQQYNIDHVYIIGNKEPQFENNYIITSLTTIESIQDQILTTIKEKFSTINYVTLTNPLDINKKDIVSITEIHEEYNIKHQQVTLFGRKYTLSGNNKIETSTSIPEGIYHLRCYTNISNNNGFFSDIESIEPVLFQEIKDPNNKVISYAQSSSYKSEQCYLDTLICNLAGDYTLTTTVYHGLKGGYFTQRGFSSVDTTIQLEIQAIKLNTPHFPYTTSQSMLAPYLTSAHGGIIIADESFSITTPDYIEQANGYGTGPWYEEQLHPFNNNKVNHTISILQQHLQYLEKHQLLTSYLEGPAWLALLGDTNMIPMYYYQPSQKGIHEAGLPSDNPYMLNNSLSVGRILGYNVSDVSLLLARTFFYEDLCKQSNQEESWGNSFHFMFGEGFGETGGIFHQIPYAKEIQTYGFKTTVYGDLRNSRQLAESLSIFTSSNYNEYLGHGDWFWFTPSLYGYDIYSKAFDVAHIRNWVFEQPSIFLTSACLMGRVDGIPPQMNIGMAFLHAGCNAFIGSTRETGQEAGLETLENHLIIDDYSMGEALRGEKRVDHELPTYYVRTLYGDPAFNPYEPLNGFSKQGRP